MMFSSRGKHAKTIHATSAAVDNEDIGGDLEKHLSHNSPKSQNKINAQAADICHGESEAIQSSSKKQESKIPDQPREHGRDHDQSSQCNEHEGPPQNISGTQYKGASNYVSWQPQPQLACGANGRLESTTTCYYCKDTRNMKDNVSGWTMKLHTSCRFESRWQLLRQYQKWVPGLTFQKIAPKILDQSEGGKVCHPDQNDKLKKDKRIVVWLRQFPAKMSLERLSFR